MILFRTLVLMFAALLLQPLQIILGDDAGESIVGCSPRRYPLTAFDFGETSVAAPNHSSKVLLAKDGSFRILETNKEIGRVHLPDLSSNITIVWAPDSRKFAITYSNGGAEGAFHAQVFQLEKDSVVENSKAVDIAFRDFKSRHYCQERGNNVYVEGWTSDSRRVFVIAQVFPTGDCGEEFGLMGGYSMDLIGQITHRYSNRETLAIQSNCDKFGRVKLPAKQR